jgi:hypothetical protein
MKTSFITSLLFVWLLFSCKNTLKNQEDMIKEPQVQKEQPEVKNNTFIFVVKQEIGGKKENRYIPVVNRDTIGFTVSFKPLEDNSVMATVYFQNDLTYKEQYQLLKLLFKRANEDFPLSSLSSINIQRLFSTGDLAITVTKQLLKENLKEQLTDYKKMGQLLMNTKITTDFNGLLKPYKAEVGDYSLEKVFMADKIYLLNVAKIETQPKDVPDQILDALTWIKIQKTTAD